MVSWTITHKDILGMCGVIILLFMMIGGTFALMVGESRMVFIKDVVSGNEKYVKQDLQSDQNMTKIHFSTHEKDAVNIITSMFNVLAYTYPLFFMGLIFYILLFTRYDEKIPRDMIKGLSEWLMRRVSSERQNLREDKQ